MPHIWTQTAAHHAPTTILFLPPYNPGLGHYGPYRADQQADRRYSTGEDRKQDSRPGVSAPKPGPLRLLCLPLQMGMCGRHL